MRARGRLVCLVCAACALALPAGAMAKPGYSVFPGSFYLSAKLPKSNGYTVYLGSQGHRWVEMVVDRRGESAFYFARGKANRHGVDVDFGRFGHVHADFEGHRPKSEPIFPGCHGRRPIEVRGRLEGDFRLRGEDGYVTVSAERAKASYERTFRWVCQFGAEPADDREQVDVLEATGRAGGREIRFGATYLTSIGVPVISASTSERIGRVIAAKLTSTFSENSSLEFSPPKSSRPTTATVKPSLPFRGSASYVVQPDGSSEWSGDLRVPLAGLGQVQLTGPGFHADACRIPLSEGALKCKRPRRDARGLTALTRLPYDSGSHLQPVAETRLSVLPFLFQMP